MRAVQHGVDGGQPVFWRRAGQLERRFLATVRTSTSFQMRLFQRSSVFVQLMRVY